MVARATLKAGSIKALVDNYLFAELFNRETGFYSWKKKKPEWRFENGEWVRYRRRLRRREWIETFMRIQTKSGKIIPLILNQEQRALECMVLRMERAGVPVRVTLCKARQIGGSTYIEAVAFYEMMTSTQTKVLLVGDNGDRARMLLEIAGVARTNMPKSADQQTGEVTPWKFKMRSKATYTLSWDEPLMSQIRVASAEEDEPGQGGTRKIVHLSESASSTYTQTKIANILPSLPTLPGTYGFNESTPNGGSGWFYEVFMASWKERDKPLLERQHAWVSMFFPSWAHAEYQWTLTYGVGREMSDEQKREINRTLNQDEEWILKQTYFKRWSPEDEWMPVSMPDGSVKWSRVGVGTQKVGLDHIAWRRAKINDLEIHGDMNLMNQEYGDRVEKCIAGSAMIGTSKGIVPMRDVAAGSYATGGNEILKHWSNGVRRVVSVRTERGYTVTCTPDHLLATHGGFVRADESVGRQVVLQPPVMGGEEQVVTWQHLGSVTASLLVTEGVGRLLGYFMGDGCLSHSNFGFAGHKDDQDVSEDIQRLTREVFGLKMGVGRSSRNGTYTSVRSQHLFPILKALGCADLVVRDDGRNLMKRTVRVPPCIWRSPPNVVREFLRGLFESDGWIKENGHSVKFFSCHEDFAREVQLLLLAFGIVSKRFHIEKKNKSKTYVGCEVSLGVYEAMEFCSKIGFLSKRKRARQTTGYDPNKGGRKARVASLLDVVAEYVEAGEEEVFDMSVADSHVFDAGGVRVHNCFLASGRPVFDIEILSEMMLKTIEPWEGDIEEARDESGKLLVQPGEGWGEWTAGGWT